MKTTFIKSGVLFLFSIFLLFGCKKNDDAPIDINFSILNDNGQSTTTFNQSENFTFNLSFRNLSQDTINITTEFIDEDFFRVLSAQNNTDLGRAWTGVWCYFDGSEHIIKLLPASTFELKCSWLLNDNSKIVYPLCKGESESPLEPGDYYTSFDLNFHYSVHNTTGVFNTLTYKINFKIV